MRNFRYAWRIFWKSPGFTAIAVVTLALGIGASSTIFSVVDSVLLRPLPYADPSRLVMVRQQLKPMAPEPMPVTAPASVEIAHSGLFAQAGTFRNQRFDVSIGANPERVLGARISPSALRLLGVSPLAGRLFTDEEDHAGVHVAILGYELWRRLSGDAAVIGKTILVDREPYYVAGVMPKGFAFPPPGIRWERPADIYIPLALTPRELSMLVGDASFGLVARLGPGVSIDQASARIEGLARDIQSRYPAELLRQLPKNIQLHGVVRLLQDEAVGSSRTLLLILGGAVTLLLLIACANIAGMLLGRASSRAPEVALRLALGAGRGTLIRQFLTESLLLSVAGGILGLSLAVIATKSSSYWLPSDVPHIREIAVNFDVIAFAFAAALLTTFVFGIAPAMLAARRDLDVNLRQSRGLASARATRFTMAVVVAEIAMTLVLQTGTALLVRSLIFARGQANSADRVTSVSIALPANAYRDPAAVRGFYEEAVRRISAIPGVTAAAAASNPPYSDTTQHVYTIENREGSEVVPVSVVLGDYFDALSIPLRAGRRFRDDDKNAVIINETAARTFWQGADPIGKRIKWGVLQTPFPWMTVIGVVGDAEQNSPDREIRPQFYESFLDGPSREMSIVAQSSLAQLAEPMGAQLRSMDAALPLSRIQTLDHDRADALTPRRRTTQIVGSFAFSALILVGVGIYGMMLCIVTSRRREVAIRMALGADRASILQLVLKRALLLVSFGLAAGIAASIALSRFVQAMIYGIGPFDLTAYLATAAILLTATLAALYGPARAAASVDANVVLRED